MTPVLQSFSQGRWQASQGETSPLLDASTGEEIARMPHSGPDVAGMLQFARKIGGPELRKLTFTQRAAILKDLGKYLFARIDEFVEISRHTGATRRDTAVDVDGGIGTVAVYASKGGRELPDKTFLYDGEVELLGKGGTFGGRHIYTPKLGVAVQINAFNFPVWGMMEKFAPAFLAGMPSVVKPASQTAYLTEAVVRSIVDSGLLPEGAISLLCASPKGLIENLGAQDTVSFTGSASTANALRRSEAVIANSVPFNAEADSLNCSILGTDVVPEDDEFGIYVDQIVNEMVIKAGQKCTAIRRAFVPASIFDEVADAIAERLADIVVGSPFDENVDMGPLASREQRVEVRNRVQELLGATEIIFGDPNKVRVESADSERGAFLSPLLLKAQDLFAPQVHSVEAFGPVCTLVPYQTFGEVIDAAAMAEGSLVGSVVTTDPALAKVLISGLAPWHGRLLFVDSDNIGESTGHGVAMPQMLHGGPGRAGGGEELGGLRALKHYMQRTAIQGSPRFLESL